MPFIYLILIIVLYNVFMWPTFKEYKEILEDIKKNPKVEIPKLISYVILSILVFVTSFFFTNVMISVFTPHANPVSNQMIGIGQPCPDFAIIDGGSSDTVTNPTINSVSPCPVKIVRASSTTPVSVTNPVENLGVPADKMPHR